QNGWTQSELAKKIGIKQATISNFENNPDNTTLIGECNETGSPAKWLDAERAGEKNWY
ncbi:hypothetical protein C2U36_23280, partial [Escherichia coli]